jgi:hypothetical protein
MRNGTNELVVLELHNASAARDVDFRGEPELRPTAGENSGCDPTVGATAGAHVAMVAEQPKLAHQQAWVHRPAPGHSGQFSIALEAIPTLCLDVAAGCPHPSEGCVTVQACKPGAPSQLFLAKPDTTKPGAVELIVYGNRWCAAQAFHVLATLTLPVFLIAPPPYGMQRRWCDEEVIPYGDSRPMWGLSDSLACLPVSCLALAWLRGRSLDIFSNGKIDGSALDVWSCDTPREPNQQWKFDGQVRRPLRPFWRTFCLRFTYVTSDLISSNTETLRPRPGPAELRGDPEARAVSGDCLHEEAKRRQRDHVKATDRICTRLCTRPIRLLPSSGEHPIGLLLLPLLLRHHRRSRGPSA